MLVRTQKSCQTKIDSIWKIQDSSSTKSKFEVDLGLKDQKIDF